MAKEIIMKEYPNPKMLEIWKHPDIHTGHRTGLRKYLMSVRADGSVPVTYVMDGKFGRYKLAEPSKLSCVAMWSAIRSALFGETEVDVDLQACHGNLMLALVKEHLDFTPYALNHYCQNRDKILDSVHVSQESVDNYNKINKDNKTKKDAVKNLFTLALYGGSINTWTKVWMIEDFEPTSFVKDFFREIDSLSKQLLQVSDFEPIITETKRLKEERAREKFGKKFVKSKFHLHNGKLLSPILQEYERKVIESAFKFLKGKCKITSYNYDGFQVLKSGFEESMIDDLNIFIKQRFYPEVHFIIKPFKPPLDMAFEQSGESCFDVDVFHLVDCPNYRKEYFERFHFKVREPCAYVVEKPDGTLQVMSGGKMLEAYSHLKGSGASFMSDWNKDPKQRFYHKLDFVPPPKVCPTNYYNQWTGLHIQQVPSPIEPIDTSRFHTHILNLANNDKAGYEYIMNWMAHKVQYPSEKIKVCLIFYGRQGTGKSEWWERFGNLLLGEKYTTIAQDAEKLFGKWSNVETKLFVVCNEAEGKATFPLNQAIKDAITRTVHFSERKNIDPNPVCDYADYVKTTNNLNCVIKDKDDRRFMPFEPNPKVANLASYFKPLWADTNNPAIMRKFYEELMERPLSGWNPVIDRPRTQLAEDMEEMNADPISVFKSYLLQQKILPVGEWVNASQLYYAYKAWHKESGRKDESLLTDTKFYVIFGRLDGVTKKRVNSGQKYWLDPLV